MVYLLNIVIFYSYVSLPEGILINTGYATLEICQSRFREAHHGGAASQSIWQFGRVERNVHNRMVVSQEWVILNMIG